MKNIIVAVFSLVLVSCAANPAPTPQAPAEVCRQVPKNPQVTFCEPNLPEAGDFPAR